MPSVSKAQQRYFGQLYSKAKTGDTSEMSEKEKATMRSLGKTGIRHYAATKHSGLPTKTACDVYGFEVGTLSKLAEIALLGGYHSECDDLDDIDKYANAAGRALKSIASGAKKLYTSMVNKLHIKKPDVPIKYVPKRKEGLSGTHRLVTRPEVKLAPRQSSTVVPTFSQSHNTSGYDVGKPIKNATTSKGLERRLRDTLRGPDGNSTVARPEVKLEPNQAATTVPAFSNPTYVVGDNVGNAVDDAAGAVTEAATEAAKRPYRGRWLLGGLGAGFVLAKPFSSNEGVPPHQRVYN